MRSHQRPCRCRRPAKNKRTDMNALILFAAIGLFAAGATAGIVSVATLAIRREEKYRTLAGAATDRLTRAGRWLNGVGVRAPCRPAAVAPDALPYPYQVNVGGPLVPGHRPPAAALRPRRRP